MSGFADLFTTKLISQLLQACEDVAIPAGSAAGGEAAYVGSSVLQASLPAAGEVLPLTAAVAVFLIAGALIVTRSGAKAARKAVAKRSEAAEVQAA